jgi:hypothetical protein
MNPNDQPPAGGFGGPISPGGRIAPSAPPEPPGPPRRACSCGSSARCVAVVAQRARFFPAGNRYDYECACKRSFSVYDLAGIAFTFLAGGVVTAAGALVTMYPPGSAVGAENSNRWFGVALLVFGAAGWLMFVARVRARIVHPAA